MGLIHLQVAESISQLRQDIGGQEEPILSIRNLKTYFYTYAGVAKALDGINLDLYPGEIVGLIGETGCGKSVTALSILRLVDSPGRIVDGKVMFKNENLLEKNEDDMRKIRGHKIAMVFQDPTTYFNPVYTIGWQIAEAVRERQRLEGPSSKKDIRNKVIASLKNVGMPDPERIIDQYPHELSTGMRQRAMIAMMISFHPELLIADEATTALDVTVQAQILTLLGELTKSMRLSMLFITHNFGIVAQICDRVAVMYAGHVVEVAEKIEAFDVPLHPYTAGLMKALPKPHRQTEELMTISGSVPDLINPPAGCRFHPRCPFATDVCEMENPELVEARKRHYVACHLFKKGIVTEPRHINDSHPD
jgi:oligopeptide/dipeptide ABC transporter ATP-binding protein